MSYKFYYHFAYHLGDAVEDPRLIADHIIDKNGHILPFVRFEDGRLLLTSEALSVLQHISEGK